MKRAVLGLVVLTLFASCAGTGGGLGSMAKTSQLAPGMAPQDVYAVLGEPAEQRMVAEGMLWKYYLHQPWKGFVPYYLLFGQQTHRLERWYPDEQEFAQQQQAWQQALQPPPPPAPPPPPPPSPPPQMRQVAQSGPSSDGTAGPTPAKLDMGEGQGAPVAPTSSPWAGVLVGRQLTYLSTGSNNALEKRISLCIDGSAVWYMSSSYNIQIDSGASEGRDRGRWKLEGDRLTVQWQRRGEESFDLSKDGDKTLLNGRRWYVENKSECR